MLKKKMKISRNIYINESGIVIKKVNYGKKSTKRFIENINSDNFDSFKKTKTGVKDDLIEESVSRL